MELLLLDPVLHLTATAVVLLVQRRRRSFLDRERRDHEPRVGPLAQMLGLGHHPTFSAPGLLRLITQLGEDPGRLFRRLELLACLGQFRRDRRRQPGVLGQADQVIHAVVLTPAKDLLAAEPAVGADQDLHLRPRLADLRDDPLEGLHRAGAGINVGGTQPGTEQVVAAEDVEREIAVSLVVAVEKAAKLAAMDRVVGGVEVQNDPLGGSAVGLKKEGNEEPFDLMGLTGDLLVTALSVGPDRGQFQAVEGTLASQRLAAIAEPWPVLAGGIGLADDGGQ
ncbi:hypothetical protein Sinac_1557 [Singulisphaera acidiphila DSM 18658]|uniref:Uncharacterized protein n=1 Tax=Singulisphaera acidiphila (strain ATCC BAA-1392 / DSM 18658 / VKM B-2454 / MOB10) TaxID=886293 RepID=L0DBB9_SINAD|nr:hypothetical protein Sinac_1557 [Singulisphaera acidiphila DSM 18658]